MVAMVMVGVLLPTFSFVALDVVLKDEYRLDREAWLRDGKPCGFFWVPPQCHWWSGPMARGRVCFAWLFKTPPWIKQSPRANIWLRWYRVGVFSWNVIGLLIIAGVIGSAILRR